MKACPIFQVISAAKTVSNEIDQLLDDIVARLRKAELVKDEGKYEWNDCLPDEDLTWIEVGGALTLPVSVREMGAKKPRVRHLSIRFDLNRELPEEHSTWEHASEALIVIGYSSLKDDPWENKHLAVAGDGRLRDGNSWSGCKNSRHANGKLLQYTDASLTDGTNWAQRPWIFAVPLRSLKDPESVDKHIIQPIVSLLAKNETPDKSLAATDAITWNKDK